jgi:hypothetical protein
MSPRGFGVSWRPYIEFVCHRDDVDVVDTDDCTLYVLSYPSARSRILYVIFALPFNDPPLESIESASKTMPHNVVIDGF